MFLIKGESSSYHMVSTKVTKLLPFKGIFTSDKNHILITEGTVFHLCYKNPKKKSLKGEGFLLAHGL